MNAPLINQVTNQLDYNAYEKLLQSIESVKLEQVTDLQTDTHLTFEHSCREQMSTYYAKLAHILEETSEEV